MKTADDIVGQIKPCDMFVIVVRGFVITIHGFAKVANFIALHVESDGC